MGSMDSKTPHQEEFFLEYKGINLLGLLNVEELVKASTFCNAALSSGRQRWLNNWSQPGVLINLTGDMGCIALGIPIHVTVERVVQTYRRRWHRTFVLLLIEQDEASSSRAKSTGGLCLLEAGE